MVLPWLSAFPGVVTDSGLETDLLFHHGVELPYFAAFPLLDEPGGERLLASWYAAHVRAARDAGLGVVLETPTWRASQDWGDRLGYDAARLALVQRRSVQLLQEVREEAGTGPAVVVSGCLGPRGDGYRVDERRSPQEAEQYHAPQVAALAEAGADVVTALTLTHVEEAVGVVRAAQRADVPVVVSFTVETDGRLPDGTPLGQAVEQVDEATGGVPEYYMVNCAHPDHVALSVGTEAGWHERLRGVRANASRRSHAELDASEDLDDGDPEELAQGLLGLRAALPDLGVLGGCCGTDLRHIAALAQAWRAAADPLPASPVAAPTG